MPKTNLSPYFLILLIGVVWGVTFSLARLATEGGAHPLGLTFWQTFGGGVMLLAVCAVRRKWPVINRRFLLFYLVVGSFGSVIPGTLFFYAAPHVPAGILAITVATVPLLTYGASWLLRIDRFSVKRVSGIFAGLMAIVLLVVPDTSLPEPAMAGWVLIVLLASVCYTAENIYVDVYVPEDADMVALLAGALVLAGILVLPIILFVDAFVPLTGNWGQTEWAVAALAVFGSIAYTCFLMVLKSSGAVFASQAGYVVTLAGVLWGVIIFGEAHSGWVWLAMCLIMTGLALVTPRQLNSDQAEPDKHIVKEVNRPL
jgi:drug/metabolite transporter (DMT)-like permease